MDRKNIRIIIDFFQKQHRKQWRNINSERKNCQLELYPVKNLSKIKVK